MYQLSVFSLAFVAAWLRMETMIKLKKLWIKPALKDVSISMESTSYAGSV
jgi:hypothetical protein